MERQLGHYDLCVIGGGTAGTAAAVAAGRRGRRVLLVEEANCLGGVSTNGGVNEWFAGVRGLGCIFDELHAGLAHYGMRRGRFFNGEYLKVIWQGLADAAGVQVLYHASLIGATAAAGRVTRVQLAAVGQTLGATADFFVDASGEGDLAATAGAAFMQGHATTGKTLHLTLTFTLLDTGAPVVPYLPPNLTAYQTDDDLPGLRTMCPLPDGRIYCNMTKVMGHDPTDPVSLSAAEGEARRQMIRVVHYLQRTRFPRHALCGSGATIGIREGRRIVGDLVLKGEEILAATDGLAYPDGVAVATSQIDFHSLTRPGNDGWRQKVAPYHIPYRSLIVNGFTNLLVAGKCISGDQVAQSSYRMTPTCCMMGQAAGTAAALAREQGLTDLRALDVAALRAQLAADGMQLDPRQHKPFAPEETPDPRQAD